MSESGVTSATPGLFTQGEPWLGLESYREEDQAIFFGRTKEAEEVLRMVRREMLTVLFGPAGIGKTSLIQAGILPGLRLENYFPVTIRLNHSAGNPPADQQIRARIEEVVNQQEIETEPLCAWQLTEDGEGLWEYLHAIEFWGTRNRLLTPVLFIDQFEEVFTQREDRHETGS